jgi:hypothetical protein
VRAEGKERQNKNFKKCMKLSVVKRQKLIGKIKTQRVLENRMGKRKIPQMVWEKVMWQREGTDIKKRDL